MTKDEILQAYQEGTIGEIQASRMLDERDSDMDAMRQEAQDMAGSLRIAWKDTRIDCPLLGGMRIAVVSRNEKISLPIIGEQTVPMLYTVTVGIDELWGSAGVKMDFNYR